MTKYLTHIKTIEPLAPDDIATKNYVDVNSGGSGNSSVRNVLINGGMAIDQRNSGSAQTITAAAALAYTVDRWYAYCTGANVTGQRVQGASQNLFRYRFTGAASNTAIQFGQRIEALNSAHLAGTTCTLSVDLANSLLTTVAWTAFYANTTNTFGSIASPTRTQIATGTFTVNSTVTRYSTQISIPAAAATGIEIVFSVVNQTSGTWTIGDVQLEAGPVATPFERRSYGQELALCQRYFQTLGNGCSGFAASSSIVEFIEKFLVEMRAAPSVAWRTGATARWRIYGVGDVNNGNSLSLANTSSTPTGLWSQQTGFTGITAGAVATSRNSTNDPFINISAEL